MCKFVDFAAKQLKYHLNLQETIYLCFLHCTYVHRYSLEEVCIRPLSDEGVVVVSCACRVLID